MKVIATGSPEAIKKFKESLAGKNIKVTEIVKIEKVDKPCLLN